MRLSIVLLLVSSLCVACSGAGPDEEPPPFSCPASGCDNASCIGQGEGAKCVGYTPEEKRGWAGFCVSGICTEYVAVKCEIAPGMVIQGCDGTGTVTGGFQLYFHEGRCVGTEGEFGYCNSGEACAVFNGDKPVGQGACQ